MGLSFSRCRICSAVNMVAANLVPCDESVMRRDLRILSGKINETLKDTNPRVGKARKTSTPFSFRNQSAGL
jgi:hypothetical protein